MKKSILTTVFLLVFILCISLPTSIFAQNNHSFAGPPVIIYKTKKNYDKNVAIVLSEDKSTIVSYPDPKDVIKDDSYCYPTRLTKKYLLDNRGINENVAFLSITYEEYAKLKKVPSTQELEAMIINKNPLKKMYRCGTHFEYNNLIEELNHKIKKRCRDCQRIK